jgi:hypothetical protein
MGLHLSLVLLHLRLVLGVAHALLSEGATRRRESER